MTWLADNQMHKVGYPNLNAGYSEEDSRDAADRDNMDITHRVTRRSNDLKTSKYLYDYDEGEMEPRRRRSLPSLRSKNEIRPRRESNDKENKKDVIVNGRGRLRSSKTETEIKTKDDSSENEEEDFREGDNKEEEEDAGEVEVNGDVKEDVENKGKQEEEEEEEQSLDSSDEKVVLAPPRPRTTKTRGRMLRNTNFSARDTRNQKVLESSSESEEEGRKYSLRDRPPKPAPKTSK